MLECLRKVLYSTFRTAWLSLSMNPNFFKMEIFFLFAITEMSTVRMKPGLNPS